MDHACDALTHEAGDVQAAAVKLLERHAGVLTTDTRERLADLTQHADPALRERLAALAGRSTPERRTRAAVTVPAPLPIDPATVPRLRVNAPLEPIADLDELLDLAFVLLETTGTPDDFERLVDGVARFRGHEIPAGRRKALDRAVGFRNQAMYGRVLQQRPTPVISLLVGLVEDGWGGYWVYRGPRAALDRRQAVVAACAGPRQLLSFPTHRGGFIDARVLAERLLVADDAYDDDLAQALLRLAPEGHAEALAALGEATGEGGAVLRAALGEAQERPAEPMFPASWDAVDVLTGAVPCEIEPRPESHSYWTDDRTRAPESSPVRLLALSERQYDVGRELAACAGWRSCGRATARSTTPRRCANSCTTAPTTTARRTRRTGRSNRCSIRTSRSDRRRSRSWRGPWAAWRRHARSRPTSWSRRSGRAAWSRPSSARPSPTRFWPTTRSPSAGPSRWRPPRSQARCTNTRSSRPSKRSSRRSDRSDRAG